MLNVLGSLKTRAVTLQADCSTHESMHGNLCALRKQKMNGEEIFGFQWRATIFPFVRQSLFVSITTRYRAVAQLSLFLRHYSNESDKKREMSNCAHLARRIRRRRHQFMLAKIKVFLCKFPLPARSHATLFCVSVTVDVGRDGILVYG